jgi:hypothetical protein
MLRESSSADMTASTETLAVLHGQFQFIAACTAFLCMGGLSASDRSDLSSYTKFGVTATINFILFAIASTIQLDVRGYAVICMMSGLGAYYAALTWALLRFASQATKKKE